MQHAGILIICGFIFVEVKDIPRDGRSFVLPITTRDQTNYQDEFWRGHYLDFYWPTAPNSQFLFYYRYLEYLNKGEGYAFDPCDFLIRNFRSVRNFCSNLDIWIIFFMVNRECLTEEFFLKKSGYLAFNYS